MTERTESSETRASYLLDGRRVTIGDLIGAGLLAEGDALRFKRPRVGRTYRAVVTAAGTVSLEGVQEFRSPSRAAAVAADMPAVDGWHAWTVASSGRSLDSLRQELLDQVATSTAVGSAAAETAPDSQRRYERLKEIRARADAKDPVEISVRELLAMWDAKMRGTRINQRIEADLANHGLATSPSFRKVTIDATVHLVTGSQEAEVTGSTAPVVDDDVDELDVGLTVGNLPSALGGVESVPPTATFDQAITIMVLNGYSQLAVLTGRHSLRGAVTWQSIAHARHANPSASFADAIVRAREARYDQELIEVLPDLETWDFVFVRDEKNAVAGIVTTADVVGAYRELATPFFLIGELDQIFRQLISRTFTLEEVTSLCDPDGSRPVRSFDDLEMGDYQRVLENPDRWQQLGWPLDRATFIKRLDELRIVRNNVTHFNPEPVPPDAVEKLRYILKLLRDYGGLITQ
ncbi:MAG: restriction system modified-DNA reader domain-containing protein [Streptosporangiaceae bacterium]